MLHRLPAAAGAAGRLRPELRGILLTLLAMGLFGAMDGISKVLVSHYPTPLVLWLRHLAALPLAFLILAPKRPFTLLRSRAPRLQVGRSLLLAVEMGFALAAFGAMPLADAHAIFAVVPLLVTALSVPLLGERVDWQRWLAVAAGFAGVLVIVRPGLAVLQPGATIAITATLMYAVYNILTRKAGLIDRAETGFLLQITIGAAALTLVGPFFWVPVAPHHWPLVVTQGALGALGHLCLVRALTIAPASVIQPFTYTMLIYAVIVGYFVFGDVPDLPTVAGGLIVAAAGIYAALRQREGAKD
jgi:drug/metabolite transporter (DMT)-like permease